MDADIFLLSDTERKYFTNLITAFYKALKEEGVDPAKLEMTEEQLQKIGGKLPYSPANAIRKWETATSKPYFMLMAVENYKPAPHKPESEPLASNEFFLGNNISSEHKTRYTVTTEWHCLRGDNRDFLFKSPLANTIEENSPAYSLINRSRDTMDGDRDIMTAIRDALGLAGYFYIPFGLFTSMTVVTAVCKEYLKLPPLPSLSQGRQLTIETSIQTLTAPATTYSGKNFSTIRQGTSTNALTKLRAADGKELTIDQITGDATIKNGNFILTIPSYTELAGLKTSTCQLLDAITVALTESGAKSPTVILPLAKYMRGRGLKDRKEAKTQAKADMEILRGASISWEERRGKKTERYSFVNLADSGEIRRNGDIVFVYGTTFYNTLLGYSAMPYPAQLQTLNNKRNPNSYYLLRKISEHKYMNIGKKNENIIAVKTLLSVAQSLPTYEEVMETGRQLDQRIIKPFERDMDALDATLSWNYCHSSDQPLTDEELATMSYSTFVELLIHTEWKNYPDQTARLERKAEAVAQAQKKKRTTSKKKKPAGE